MKLNLVLGCVATLTLSNVFAADAAVGMTDSSDYTGHKENEKPKSIVEESLGGTEVAKVKDLRRACLSRNYLSRLVTSKKASLEHEKELAKIINYLAVVNNSVNYID